MNLIKLFKERLKREGRYDIYMARVEELKQHHPGGQTGMDAAQVGREAQAKAREEFGFLGKGEVPVSKEFLDAQYLERRARKQRDAQKQYRQKKRDRVFLEALAALPHTTDPAKEMDWVGSHPALLRQARGEVTEDTGKVLITVADVTSSIVGPAPSKRAVIILQNQVDSPTDFLKVLLSEHKKAQGSGDVGEGNEAVDLTIDEVRKMLAATDGDS